MTETAVPQSASAPSAHGILPLDPATYVRHPVLHGEDRAWPETNCYVDLWIEVLHALHLDPIACMGFTVAMGFEGDQWTFFKPSLSEIYELYGVDVQELTIWRPVVEHVIEQVGRGRMVLVEVDSYFLPDTHGVSYHIEHTKTTIAVQSIDPANRTIGYFHNAGYFSVSGDDYDGLFRLGAYAADRATLAPYTEFAKLDDVTPLPEHVLRERASHALRRHLGRAPQENPVARYREHFLRDLEWLATQDIAVFHQYAFATLRQCGASAEVAATFLRWLGHDGRDAGLTAAAEGFDAISNGAKALQFKVARAVATRKPADVSAIFDNMQAGWDTAMAQLAVRRAS